MSRGHRASTTPMDFEWSNQHGPVDERSPFISAVKKRSHADLESPSKNAGFATPNRTQSYFFSTPQANERPLPSIPSHVQNSRTWEPRTPASLVDFSSGGETPNTPAIDSEQATPDTQMASKMGRLFNADPSKSPKKVSRRDSWFNKIFTSSPSPMKDKDESRKSYSKKGENRVSKRRSKKKIMLREEGDDSDNEHHSKKVKGSQEDGKVKQTFAMSMAGFLSWVEAHPNLPSVLSYYMQLTVNTFLGLGFIYIVYACWSGIMNDVEIQSSKYVSEIMIEQALCTKHYHANRCQPGARVPGMEADCNAWEKCMSRDPRKVARASVTAKTFAMIFNSFVEEFSYKSMIFTAIVFFGGFNLSNWAFGFIREKKLSHHQQNDFGPPPQTPHRYPSNGYLEHQQWQQTPFQTPYGSMNQHMLQQNMATQSMPALALPSTSEGVEEKRKTPSRTRSFW